MEFGFGIRGQSAATAGQQRLDAVSEIFAAAMVVAGCQSIRQISGKTFGAATGPVVKAARGRRGAETITADDPVATLTPEKMGGFRIAPENQRPFAVILGCPLREALPIAAINCGGRHV